MALGLVLAFVGRRLRLPPRDAAREGQRRGARSVPARPADRPVLLPVAAGCVALGVPLMIVFDAPVTRILGVALLLGFIVSGVFLIADPAFLGGEDDEAEAWPS